MAIELDIVKKDGQKLPAVSWVEDRNIFAPGGMGRERVSCFIRPEEESGELQFVKVGKARHGDEVEVRPWGRLISFELAHAEQLYLSAQDKALMQLASGKNRAAGLLFTDGALVVVAHFGDVPMHINCADASPAQAQHLYGVLKREFIDQRPAALHEAGCQDEYVWPKDTPFEEFTPPVLEPPPWWHALVEWGAVALVLGLLVGGFYWLVMR